MATQTNPTPAVILNLDNFELVNENRFNKVFDIVNEIGAGGFGIVYKVRNRMESTPEHDIHYAVKVIRFNQLTEDNRDISQLLNEVHINARMSTHKNIVNYKTSWIEYCSQQELENWKNGLDINTCKERHESGDEPMDTDVDAVESSVNDMLENLLSATVPVITPNPIRVPSSLWGPSLFVQMELCKQSLDNYLNQRNDKIEGRLPDKSLMKFGLKIIRDVTNGIRFLHRKRIAHKDITRNNILFGFDKMFKIADLGYSSLRGSSDENDNSNIGSLSGSGRSFNRRPPEWIPTSDGRGEDLWDLGILMLDVFYKFNAITDRNEAYVYRSNLYDKRLVPNDLQELYPNIARLMIWLTELHQKDRPISAAYVLRECLPKLLNSELCIGLKTT
ncbi:probable serine/threonine-protein kinase DDB_G0283065 [Oppia nitens]|uniref:probable serine/threonine-protein kinase DDB_G0283065 n=1 Tax=Oppia nitens TaxID=1686743 RepID=UPI0023DA60FC|nr:probable serine/threonine-protein kinase DDB_G0283065 [Oppia nitens]